MDFKRFLIFTGKVIITLVIVNFAVGLIAYPLLTKDLFEDPDSILTKIFRTPAEPDLWNKVFIWILPVQILRAFLIAVVLYPFFDTLIGWRYWKRFLSIAGLLVVLGHLAGSSGIIEGLVMMRPEFVTPHILLKTLPEPIIQGLVISAWLAKWMAVKPKEKKQKGN